MATGNNVLVELTAKDVMTRGILAVRPDWSLEEVADFLVRNEIHGAPVTSETGDLLGVVSITDLARESTLSSEDLSQRARHEFYHRLLDEPYRSDEPAPRPQEEHRNVKVQEIMTPVVLSVDESTMLRDVAQRMVGGRVHRLFVTAQGKTVGIISALDLLEVLSEP